MSLDKIIFEVGPERQESEGYAQLDQDFFLRLHQTQIRYIKLKYGRKSKETERELNNVVMDLVTSYTDCIDYFGTFGDASVVYFQVKIKEINKYFQFLNTQLIQTPEVSKVGKVDVSGNKKDLGSISEQTGPELLPEEERLQSIAGKEALNQNLMAYLQTQDITSHIKENLKKEEKIFTVISESLKRQDEDFMKRKRIRRNMSKSRVFLSFSQRNLDSSKSPEPSETSQLMIADMDALQVEGPQQMRALALKLEEQLILHDKEDQEQRIQI